MEWERTGENNCGLCWGERERVDNGMGEKVGQRVENGMDRMGENN